MSNATLLRRVRVIERRLTPPQAPRDYCIELEEGEEVSEALMKQLGEQDQLIIRYYPKGYLGEPMKSTHGQVMSCWLKGPRGKLIPHLVREYGVDISKV